jgi:hypothetical protein
MDKYGKLTSDDPEENPLLDIITGKSLPVPDKDDEISHTFDLNSMEGVLQVVGAFKTFQFMGNMNHYLKAQILRKLKETRAYRHAGCRNFEGLCKVLGISARTGHYILSNIDTFGKDTYNNMINIGLKNKHLNLLKIPEIAKVSGNEITINNERIEIIPENKEIILNTLKKKEKEIELEKIATKKAKEETDAAKEKVKELEKRLAPFADDEKTFEDECAKKYVDFMSLTKQIEKLMHVVDKTENKNIPILFEAFMAKLQTHFTQFVAKLYSD